MLREKTWVAGISTYKETADWCKSKTSLEGIECPLIHQCIINIICKATYLEGLNKSIKHKFDSLFNYELILFLSCSFHSFTISSQIF